jgi:acyl-CoA thioester hydrolase
MGITHHSNYIRFMEEARVDWMDQLGFGFEKMEAEGVVSPVVSVECRYRQPSTFKDVIEITVTVAETTPLKVIFAYTMTVTGKTICTATSTHCFLENGRPISLEKRFQEFYKRVMQVGK